MKKDFSYFCEQMEKFMTLARKQQENGDELGAKASMNIANGYAIKAQAEGKKEYVLF